MEAKIGQAEAMKAAKQVILAAVRGGRGEYHLTYEPKRKLPVADFMRPQGRFRHCFAPGGEWMLEEAQAWVDKKWEKLLAKCR